MPAKVVKITPWTKIKAEYLQGVTPKELAQKYDLTAKQVSNRASREKWTIQNEQIRENVSKKMQDKIQSLTNNALEVLSGVMNDTCAEDKDRVSAAKAILNISGLKNSKQEIEVKDVPIIIDDIT